MVICEDVGPGIAAIAALSCVVEMIGVYGTHLDLARGDVRHQTSPLHDGFISVDHAVPDFPGKDRLDFDEGEIRHANFVYGFAEERQNLGCT